MVEFIDNGTAPEFYVDDIAFVDDLGSCCRVGYFTWMRNPATSLLQRVVVLTTVRPKQFMGEDGKTKRMMLDDVTCKKRAVN